jgi:protease II
LTNNELTAAAAAAAAPTREPAKLVAKLRELKTDKHLLLFKCELGAGHFSVTGR